MGPVLDIWVPSPSTRLQAEAAPSWPFRAGLPCSEVVFLSVLAKHLVKTYQVLGAEQDARVLSIHASTPGPTTAQNMSVPALRGQGNTADTLKVSGVCHPLVHKNSELEQRTPTKGSAHHVSHKYTGSWPHMDAFRSAELLWRPLCEVFGETEV